MTFRERHIARLIFAFLFFSLTRSNAQILEVLDRSSFASNILTESIFPLDPTIDTSLVIYVAKVKVTATPEKSSLVELFQKIKYKAKGIGASGYKITDYLAETDSTPASITMNLFAFK